MFVFIHTTRWIVVVKPTSWVLLMMMMLMMMVSVTSYPLHHSLLGISSSSLLYRDHNKHNKDSINRIKIQQQQQQVQQPRVVCCLLSLSSSSSLLSSTTKTTFTRSYCFCRQQQDEQKQQQFSKQTCRPMMTKNYIMKKSCRIIEEVEETQQQQQEQQLSFVSSSSVVVSATKEVEATQALFIDPQQTQQIQTGTEIEESVVRTTTTTTTTTIPTTAKSVLLTSCTVQPIKQQRQQQQQRIIQLLSYYDSFSFLRMKLKNSSHYPLFRKATATTILPPKPTIVSSSSPSTTTTTTILFSYHHHTRQLNNIQPPCFTSLSRPSTTQLYSQNNNNNQQYYYWEGDDRRWFTKFLRNNKKRLGTARNKIIPRVRNCIVYLNVFIFCIQVFDTILLLQKRYPQYWPKQAFSMIWDSIQGNVIPPGPFTYQCCSIGGMTSTSTTGLTKLFQSIFKVVPSSSLSSFFTSSSSPFLLLSTTPWYKVVTSGFCHGGLIHLIASMGTLLYMIPKWLETGLGSTLYGTTYLFSMIVGNIGSTLHHGTTITTTYSDFLCGAHTGISGLYGLLFICLLRMHYKRTILYLLPKVLWFYFAYSTIFAHRINVMGNVYSFCTGLIIGYLCGPKYVSDYSMKRKNSLEVLVDPRIDNEYKQMMGYQQRPTSLTSGAYLPVTVLLKITMSLLILGFIGLPFIQQVLLNRNHLHNYNNIMNNSYRFRR